MVDGVTEFERYRSRLRGIAYRMLGSLDEAEDTVQKTYLRWHRADVDSIQSAEGWLVTAVTRLCIDRLRAAAVERKAYIGPWLPEPWIGIGSADADPAIAAAPDSRLDRAADLSMAFLVMLEQLRPDERAAFLLRDVFEIGYADIASALGKGEGACRQIVRRARGRVREGGSKFVVSETARHQLLQHTRDARARGETEERLYLLAAWRESPLYSERERAALAWTEALTLVSQTHAPDAVYGEARRHFSEEELVKLTVAVGLINTWNRIAIGFRSVHPLKPSKAA